MKFCLKCGARLGDDAAFCPNCGAAQPNPQQGGQPNPQPYRRAASNPATPYIIWSIVLIVVGGIIGKVLGVIAIVYAVGGNRDRAPEQNLKMARTFCIVGTCVVASGLIIGFAAAVVGMILHGIFSFRPFFWW